MSILFKDAALIVAGIVFTIVAIAHFIRIFFQIDIQIMNKSVPMMVSYIGFVVSLILAIWMFIA